MRYILRTILASLLFFAFQSLTAQETIRLNEWLYSGTLQIHKPVYGAQIESGILGDV